MEMENLEKVKSRIVSYSILSKLILIGMLVGLSAYLGPKAVRFISLQIDNLILYGIETKLGGIDFKIKDMGQEKVVSGKTPDRRELEIALYYTAVMYSRCDRAVTELAQHYKNYLAVEDKEITFELEDADLTRDAGKPKRN